jgi:ankyrin repeat protein
MGIDTTTKLEQVIARLAANDREQATEFLKPLCQDDGTSQTRQATSKMLLWIIEQKQYAVFQLALNCGIGPDTCTRDLEQCPLLHLALSKADPSLATILLEAGADPSLRDRKGNTALHHLAQSAHQIEPDVGLTLFKRCVEAGNDVNAPDNSGRGPLHCVTDDRAVWIIEALCLFHADPNLRDKMRYSPIMEYALRMPLALRKQLQLEQSIRTLVRYGADPDSRNERNSSILHVLANIRQKDAIPLLIELGADIDGRNNDGVTPLMYAASSCCVECVDVLLSLGANRLLTDSSGSSALDSAQLFCDGPELHAIESLLLSG